MNGTANHLEYGNFQDAITLSYGGTKIEIPKEYKKRSAEYWPERFVMPVAIIASGKDRVVPPHSVLRLAEILEKMRRPLLAIYQPGMGHASKPEDAQRALNFVLDQALRPVDTATKTAPESQDVNTLPRRCFQRQLALDLRMSTRKPMQNGLQKSNLLQIAIAS